MSDALLPNSDLPPSPLGHKPNDFPETERAARETLALPIYPEISRDAQRYVVNSIAEFFE